MDFKFFNAFGSIRNLDIDGAFTQGFLAFLVNKTSFSKHSIFLYQLDFIELFDDICYNETINFGEAPC